MAEAINYEAYRLGTKDGEIMFGHLRADNFIDSVYISNYYNPTSQHYIALTQTGQTWQRNSTTCRSTGSFQVKAGDACQKGDPGIFLDAVSGDIIIKAASGKIRMSAQNIEMVADGKDGKNGIIKMKTNEKIILDAGQMVDIKCPVSVKIFSDKTVEVIGKGITNIYGGICDFRDGADAALAAIGSPSKGGGSDNESRQSPIGG